jgi:hypothetical protein
VLGLGDGVSVRRDKIRLLVQEMKDLVKYFRIKVRH